MFAHLDTDNDELLSSAELYALRKYSVPILGTLSIYLPNPTNSTYLYMVFLVGTTFGLCYCRLVSLQGAI